MKTDLCSLSATDLLRSYAKKQLSPVEATRAVLERIANLNPVLNAFCHLDFDYSLKEARKSEKRWAKGSPQGSLDGVPVSIKDLLLTRGWPTLRGSKTIDPRGPWHDDAPVVARLREHGAVLLGKTTTPEFGWKGVTDSPLTGVTRNPWNLKMTPGGSSGGGAAAVAAGMGPLTVGTDGGGSIRIPCAFTGLFGLKPSFGRVPAWPLSPMGTVAHVGPMTRTVTDAALMMNVLSLPDLRDWHALPHDARDYRIGPQDKLSITVFQVKDLSVEKMQVDATGRILLPLIGSVEAQGRTTTELGREIATRLEAKYLHDPQVSVVVEESASQKVTVEGAVNEAGVFQLRGRTSLLEAVAMAKGPSRFANTRRVAIIRTVNGESKAAVFDLAAIMRGQARNPEILGNDIVVVDDSKSKQMWHDFVTTLPAFLIFTYF